MILLDIEYALNNNDFKEANTLLGELFISLSEFKRVIDVVIYNKIVKFKDIFKANYHKKKIAFIDLSNAENKKVIMTTFNEVLSIIKEKTEELKN